MMDRRIKSGDDGREFMARRHFPCRKIPWPASPDAPCSGMSNRGPWSAGRHFRQSLRATPQPMVDPPWQNLTARVGVQRSSDLDGEGPTSRGDGPLPTAHGDTRYQYAPKSNATHCAPRHCLRFLHAALTFFFNAPPTTEIYTLSLPDSLPT